MKIKTLKSVFNDYNLCQSGSKTFLVELWVTGLDICAKTEFSNFCQTGCFFRSRFQKEIIPELQNLKFEILPYTHVKYELTTAFSYKLIRLGSPNLPKTSNKKKIVKRVISRAKMVVGTYWALQNNQFTLLSYK